MNDNSGNPMSDVWATPSLEGNHTRVRAVAPPDYEWLFRVAVHSSAGSRWRLHGELPNYDQFRVVLFQNTTATCIVEDLEARPLGMVQLFNLEQLSRHAQVTAFLQPEAEGLGWPLEGLVLYMDYAFQAFDLRKLYFETLETEVSAFQSLVGKYIHEEGRLREHRYVFGRYVDCLLLAIYRDDLNRFRNDVALAGR